MAFMKPFVTAEQKWIELDTAQGIVFLPGDLMPGMVSKLAEGELAEDEMDDFTEELLQCTEVSKPEDIYEVSVKAGYGARMSAPGYMDCTPWTVFNTQAEAEKYLADEYGDDEEGDDDDQIDIGAHQERCLQVAQGAIHDELTRLRTHNPAAYAQIAIRPFRPEEHSLESAGALLAELQELNGNAESYLCENCGAPYTGEDDIEDNPNCGNHGEPRVFDE